SLLDLHRKVDVLTAKSLVPPPSIPSPSPLLDSALSSSVVKGIADEKKIREKSKRAVLVGSAELATPEETAKMDEHNLKRLIEKANNSELTDAYNAGLFSHKRHPEKKKNTLRDKFLSCIRVIGGRPEEFTPSMYVRRDLMPIELLQEKKVKAEALRRNRECGFLKWGVRDTDVIKFSGPNYRPLPDRLRNCPTSPRPSNCIPSSFSNHSSSISFYYGNSRSVKAKIDTLTCFLKRFHLLAISETWLDCGDLDVMLLRGTSNHFLFRADRVAGRGGGVLLYAHINLLPITVSTLTIPGFECLTVDIFPLSSTQNRDCLRVIVVYRAPNSPSPSMAPFIDYLSNVTGCTHPSLIVDKISPPSRDFSNADWVSMNNIIASHNWTLSFMGKNIFDAYEYFSAFINELITTYVPLKKTKTNNGFPKYLSILYDRLQRFHANAPNSDLTHSLRKRFDKALKSFETNIPKCNGSPDKIPNILYCKNLNFGYHITQITRKTRSMCNLMLRSFHTNSPDILMKAYKIYIRPLLESSTVIWNPTAIGLVNRLENVQREFTRRVLKRTRQPPLSYLDRLKLLNIETLEYRRALRDMQFVYDSIHGHALLDTTNLYSLAPLARSLRFAQSLRISIPCRLPVSISTCASRSITLWNNLPSRLVTAPKTP
ncbi:hypothetical protein PFISCL1PPCAC_12803, partial [Pristionchus fissidentatus]